MGRSDLRRGVWALAILTCVFGFAEQNAFANDNQGPRVEAAGWFFTPNFSAPDFSAEVKFGVTGKIDSSKQLGRFDYYNHFTKMKVNGKLNSVQFHPTTCGDPSGFGAGPAVGSPAATVLGRDDQGGEFQMELVDGGDAKGSDWVCNVLVTGRTKTGIPSTDSDAAQPVVRGSIRIRNFSSL